MEKENLQNKMELFYAECVSLCKNKNSDYTKGDDAFGNFKSISAIGINPIDGFLTRIMDKVNRVASLAHSNDSKVKDESIKDTLIDLANYACLLSLFISNESTTVNTKNAVRLLGGNSLDGFSLPLHHDFKNF